MLLRSVRALREVNEAFDERLALLRGRADHKLSSVATLAAVLAVGDVHSHFAITKPSRFGLLAIGLAEQRDLVGAGVAAYERGDYAAALTAWRPLAEAGNADAEYFLGVLHQHGLGVARDDLAASRWYRRAAEQGGYLLVHRLAGSIRNAVTRAREIQAEGRHTNADRVLLRGRRRFATTTGKSCSEFKI